MIKEEWKQIFSQKFLIVALIVIGLVPMLYAVIFLGSMWDPYGNIDKLPVAVVNEDQSVDYQGETLAIGDELVSNMKKSSSLNFHFTNAEEASKGLEEGDYYMILTIPKDFSKNAATLMDDNPKQLTLDYQTTKGRNFTSSKMADSVVTQLKSEVSTQVTSLYTKAVLSQLANVGEGMGSAADGTQQLADGTSQIADGSKAISENLEKLADSTLTFSDGTNTFYTGLTQYINGVSQVNDGTTQLNDGVSALSNGVLGLRTGIGALSDGATSLNSGISDYTNGVTSLSEGTATLANNGTSLVNGLNTLVSSVESGSSELADGASSLTDGLQTLSKSIPTDNSQVDTIVSTLPQLQASIKELNNQVSNLPSGSNDSLADLASGLSEMKTALTNMQSTINSFSTDGTLTVDTTSAANTIDSAVADNIKQTEAYQNADDDQKAALLAAASSAISDAADQAIQSNATTSKVDTSGLTQVSATLQTLIDNISTMETKVSEAANASSAENMAALTEGVAKINAASEQLLPGAVSAIETQQAGLSTIKTILDQQIIPGAQTLESGLSTLSNSVSSGATQLTSGLSNYVNGVNTVNEGAQTLAGNSSALTSGASQLTSGLTTVNNSMPHLVSGVTTLQDGTKSLALGAGQLLTKGAELEEGAATINNGASQLSDGAAQLSDGQKTILTAIGKVDTGLGIVTEQLNSGANTIAGVNTNAATAEAISSPVTSAHTDADTVANNGTGMAPYMMSVALFVGGIAVSTIYDFFDPKKKPTSGVAWWASKMSVLFGLGLFQAIVMFAALMMINGFNPVNHMATLGVLVVESITFMSIIAFFNLLLKKAGAFVVLLFMILQLSGSGGTYPIELSGRFFQVIHPYLPMTYGIEALRKTVSIGISSISDVFVLLGIAVVFNLLIVCYFALQKNRYQEVTA